MRERGIYPQDCLRTVRSRRNRFGNTELACSPKYHGAKTAYWAVGRQTGNYPVGCRKITLHATPPSLGSMNAGRKSGCTSIRRPPGSTTASPQLGSCCVGDFLAANSTGTNRPPAEAALLFLFQRRFFR